MGKGPGLFSDIGKKSRGKIPPTENSRGASEAPEGEPKTEESVLGQAERESAEHLGDTENPVFEPSISRMVEEEGNAATETETFGFLIFDISRNVSMKNIPLSSLPTFRDLLYRDFLVDQKFSLTTYTPTGLVFTSTGIKKGEFFLGDLTTQLKNKNITTDIKVDTSSNLFATVTIDEPTPGLKAILSFTVPDQRSGKVELQYLHDYAGISTSIGLTAAPVVETSVVIGNEGVALGGEFAFDTASGNFTKYNAGLNFVQPDFISSLNLTDRGDTLKASYLHTVSPLTKTAVGAEIAHSISRNENTFTMGTQHAFDPFTTVKARLNNHGKVAALVQHEWRPKSLITLSGEVDSKALDNSAKIGLSLVLKP